MQKLTTLLTNLFSRLKQALIDRLPLLRQTAAKLMIRLQPYFKKLAARLNMILRKGGLRLKLILFTASLVLITSAVLTTLVIYLMGDSIEAKAFDISTVSVERVADFSALVLKDRTYENRLLLNRKLNETRLSQTDGVLDISVYESQRVNHTSAFKYLAGFGRYEEGTPLDDARLIGSLNDTTPDTLTYETHTIETKNGTFDAYRFVKPIIIRVQDRPILLGVVILYYDKDKITEGVDDTIRDTLIITLLLLIAAVYLADSAANRMVATLKEDEGKINDM